MSDSDNDQVPAHNKPENNHGTMPPPDDSDDDNREQCEENQDSDDGAPFAFGAGMTVFGPSFSPLRIATTTCLHMYAIARMEGAQTGFLPWPPLMLVVIQYLYRSYRRPDLVTERNIAMLELLLRVPIQLRIKRAGCNGVEELLDLNDKNTLDYSGMSFSQSIEILRDLLTSDVIAPSDLRISLQELGRY